MANHIHDSEDSNFEITSKRRKEIADGQGTPWKTPCGGCSTIELLPNPAGQIGFEPTTRDNPRLRPIEREAGKGARVEFPSVLLLHYRRPIRWREPVTTAGETTERS